MIGNAFTDILINRKTNYFEEEKIMNREKISQEIQRFGRSLLLPIAIMAPVGMVLGLTGAFVQPYMVERVAFLQNDTLQMILVGLRDIADVIFGNIPILFAMGVAYGMTRNDKGIAVFTSIVSYLMLHGTINAYLSATGTLADPEVMAEVGQGMILGIQTLRIDVLGGIIAGLIASYSADRFYRTELPLAFAFFAGTKFVPIIASVFTIVAGLIIPVIWKYFIIGLTSMSGIILSKFGPPLSIAINRLLIPFGLHHVWTAFIRFTPAGGVYMIGGEEFVGILNALNEVLFNHGPGTEAWDLMPELTRFMAQNQMLLTLFMIPAVGLAMYHTAYDENKKAVKGIIFTLVLTPFLGNITEPMEFSFLFISPLLYGIYILLVSVGSFFLATLGTAVGYIRGTIFDFAIFGLLYEDTKWYNLLIVGIPLAVATYFIFRYLIVKWDVKTPGREGDSSKHGELLANREYDKIAAIVIEGLGGADNIINVENCVTRLRIDLKDTSKADKEVLEKSGTTGLFFPAKNHIHVVFGPQVEFVRHAVDDALKERGNPEAVE